MKDYRLLVIGRSTEKGTLDINDVTECWHFITITALKYLAKLPHIKVEYAHIHHPKRDGYDYSALPECDYVLFIGLPETWDEIDKDALRKATKYKKAVSLLERGVKGIDWAFEFRGAAEGALGMTSIQAPYDPDIYRVKPKKPGTVMLDHCCCIYVECWVHAIEKWLEPFKNEFKVHRQMQFQSEESEKASYVIPIREKGFPEYLAETDEIETFVVTHPESYGYSIIDMVARGIRVITGPGFLRPHYNAFGFETFKDRAQLVDLLRKPVQAGKLADLRSKLTPYDKIINAIDAKIQLYEAEGGLNVIQR